MKTRTRLRKLSLPLLIGLSVIALATPLVVSAQYGRADGAVFSMTNAVAGNRVVAFDRLADGRLNPARSFSTGGTGTGGGLGNQGALAISDSGNWLLAVNPGSDSVSVFFVFGNYLLRTDTRPSGGVRPVSVAIENDVVYVLNAGSDSLQGFKLGIYGRLTPIAGSKTPLSGSGTGAAQVGFNRDGDLLAVTEKATNLVLSFPVDGDGALGEVHVQASPAPTPFGFSFGRSDQLLVSEAAGGAAGASTLSSYRLDADGAASVVTGASPSGQSAACWVVTTRDGRYAYVSNTASDNLSAYSVAGNGAVGLLAGNPIAASTGAGSGPTDMALDRNSRYLYVLNPNNSTLSALQLSADGTLKTIETQASGLPASATGLVAR
jgi:6-phosphogluconolactonase (cycloisomerase 2 family)